MNNSTSNFNDQWYKDLDKVNSVDINFQKESPALHRDAAGVNVETPEEKQRQKEYQTIQNDQQIYYQLNIIS